jgi:hypothetical protein
MNACALVNTLSQQGFTLTPLPGNKLEIRPASKLTPELREELRQRKADILALLTRPYLNARGELIIPFTANPRYRWWAGGQSVSATLRELNASREVWVRHTDAPYGPVQ